MAVVARFIVDTSAAARTSRASVRARVAPLMTAGLLATCGVLDLEALHSARSPTQHREIATLRRLAYKYLPTHDEDWARAIQVHSLLAGRGQLRAVGLADLLVCAVAERERVTVLHYDADYELVAEVTGQPVQWVVPPGSVPQVPGLPGAANRLTSARTRNPTMVISTQTVATATPALTIDTPVLLQKR